MFLLFLGGRDISLVTYYGNAIDLVVLDLDGTCYDYEMAHGSGMLSLERAASFELDLGMEQFRAMFSEARASVKDRLGDSAASHDRHLYLRELLRNLGSFASETTSLHLSNLYWDAFLSSMSARPGLHDFLQFIRKAEVPITVLTNLKAEIQTKKLVELEMYKFVDLMITSEDFGSEKPNLDIFNFLKSHFPTLDRPLLVGDDQELDIEPSTKLGWSVARITPKARQKREFPDFVHLLKQLESKK